MVHAKSISEDAADVMAYLAELLPDTRAYDGCRGVDVYGDLDDPSRMVLVEHWDSRAHFDKYVAWRIESGVMERMRAILAEQEMGFFEKVDV